MTTITSSSAQSTSKTKEVDDKEPQKASEDPTQSPDAADVAKGTHIFQRGHRDREDGEKSQGVEMMQELLEKNGLALATDGKFGPETEKAVRAFQKRSGLVVDGKVGKNTLRALQSGASAVGTNANQKLIGNDAQKRAPTQDDLKSGPKEGAVSAASLQSAANAQRAKAPKKTTTAPARPKVDPDARAKEAYEAMNGGVWGLGTDEDRLFKALDGLSPEETKSVKAAYKEHYDRDMTKDVSSELSGTELKRARSLMRGDKHAATADKLHHDMDASNVL